MLLYLHPHFNYFGGGSKWVLETAERLSKKGLELIVMAQNGKKEIIDQYPHVNFFFFGGPITGTMKHWLLFPCIIKKILYEISKINPEIIFPNVFPSNYWAFLFKKKNPNVQYIWMCHEPSAFIHDKNVIFGLRGPIKYFTIAVNPFLRYLDVIFVKNYVDILLTNSKYTSKNVKRIYKRESISVGIGVDTKKYKPKHKKENFFFTINRLTKFKRVDIILRAMKILVNDYKNVKLYIGGEGEEKENLIKLSKSLKLNKNVEFLGLIPEEDVPYYHSSAIATILASINEPAGIVPLEAMASGTPVIVTKSGGIQEYVIDGKTGFLIKPNNPSTIANKMKLLIDNPNLMKKMSLAARKHIEKNYTWDNVVDKLYKIFKSS